MNYHKIETASIGNGPGFRVVLYVSGCEHHCPGCHNPETHDYKSGRRIDNDVGYALLDALNHSWVSGLTISGGDPLAPGNIETTLTIIDYVKTNAPGKTIWLYTGNIINNDDFDSRHVVANIDTYKEVLWHILRQIDVIVDGPYIESQRDITLAFRGSKNQRLIDCKETFRLGRIVELEL